MKRKTYSELKQEARQRAIDWQYSIANDIEKPSLDDFVTAQEYFEKQGKCYGLLKEFKENAIV